MARKLFFILLLILSAYSYGQAPEWVINTGAPVEEFKIDASGNIYAYGAFENTVDFDPGPNVFNMTSNGDFDAFIVKYDASGNFIWAFQIGGPERDNAYDIHLYNNEIYLLGIYNDTVDFDPGPNVNTLSTNPSTANIFLAKYNMNDGSYSWSGAIGGDQSFNTSSDGFSYYSSHPVMTIDLSNGDFYIGGKFEGTADFDLTSITFFKTAQNTTEDAFISKYANDASLIWCNTYGSETYNTTARALAVNNQGELLVSGSVKGADVDLDPGSSEFLITTSQYTNSGGQNFYTSSCYLLKFEANGNFESGRLFYGGISASGRSITIDSNDHIYLVSDLVGSIGPGNLFSIARLYKLDNSYSDLWIFQRFVTNSSFPANITSLKFNSTNDILLVGRSGGYTNESGPFLSKLDTFGNPIFGGPNQNDGLFDDQNMEVVRGNFTDMGILNDDGFLISGNTSSTYNLATVDLDISDSDTYNVLVSDYNNFLVKYNDFILEIDDDGDGVVNDLDNCLNTPSDQIDNVDANGCAGGDSNSNGLDDNAEVFLNDNAVAIIRCDDNNNDQELFDLSLNQNDILNGESTADFEFTYYHSLENAQASNNEIDNPESYLNMTSPETIYVRVERVDFPQYYDITSFEIILEPTPNLGYAATIVGCDPDNDGFTTFNLTDNETNLNNGNTYQYTYYLTEADAQTNSNALPNPESYTNITNPQPIYVQAQDITNGCITLREFDILASYTVCQFELPNTNFTIETLSETCLDSDNAEIIINAQETYDYQVSLTSNGTPINIPVSTFTETLTLSNLSVGEYEVCISIPSENYNICYTIIINTSPELSRQSNVSNRLYRVELIGATKYYVEINQDIFEVFSSNSAQTTLFETELVELDNTILIYTDHECKGVLQERITLDESLIFNVSPNPFRNSIRLSVLSKNNTSTITIIDVTGKLVYQEQSFEALDNYELNLDKLASGMYILQVATANNLFTKRIIKQ